MTTHKIMFAFKKIRPLSSALLIAAIVSACATTNETKPSPEQKAQAESNEKGRAALLKGISFYQAGDYPAAESALLSHDIWDAQDATKISALKYLAFTYCVTERKTLCRQSFDRALQLDGGFNLEPAEHAHPLWGSAFESARADRSRLANNPSTHE